MAAKLFETADEVLEANPPVPVTLYSDWWTVAERQASGSVKPYGKNAAVTSGAEYVGLFSWAAVLQALNDSSGATRLPIHAREYLRRAKADKPAAYKFLTSPK